MRKSVFYDAFSSVIYSSFLCSPVPPDHCWFPLKAQTWLSSEGSRVLSTFRAVAPPWRNLFIPFPLWLLVTKATFRGPSIIMEFPRSHYCAAPLFHGLPSPTSQLFRFRFFLTGVHSPSGRNRDFDFSPLDVEALSFRANLERLFRFRGPLFLLPLVLFSMPPFLSCCLPFFLLRFFTRRGSTPHSSTRR